MSDGQPNDTESRRFFNSPFAGTIADPSISKPVSPTMSDGGGEVQSVMSYRGLGSYQDETIANSPDPDSNQSPFHNALVRPRDDSALTVDEQAFREREKEWESSTKKLANYKSQGAVSIANDDGEENEEEKKAKKGMRVGYYQVNNRQLVRYVFIPKTLLRGGNFNFDDAFYALNLKTPDLIFELNNASDPSEWNLRLPEDKKHLRMREPYDPDKDDLGDHRVDKYLVHYQGVVRENCRRLLRATSAACSQAGAVFTTRCTWDMKQDCVAKWIDESGDVPILLVGGKDSFAREYYSEMIEGNRSKSYNANESQEETDELIKDRIRIDPAKWKSGERKPKNERADGNGRTIKGIPHPNGSHLIISDDLKMLEEKLERRIPTGYIIINGRAQATQKFCEAVQMGKPVFVFKHTGNAADLICETLKKANEFVQKRRVNPRAHPSKPFNIDLPDNYSHERYVWPFDAKMLQSCMTLNIFMDNFPAGYNPLSVLAIDMFTMTEEKLQDQLTKTMSVAFEGMVEMGGAALETRRLTYAWRLRHLLDYNAARQKRFSDLLQSLCILFSTLSTFAAVVYGYLLYIGIIGPGNSLVGAYGLVALNLLLPLAVTVLRGMIASLNPLSKYAVLKGTAIKVESEIYLYRTKCGKYNMRKTPVVVSPTQKRNNDSNDQEQQNRGEDEQRNNPRKVFSSSLDQIWLELASSDIAKGSMMTPPDNCDPLDSVNAMLKSNIRQQRLLTQSLRQPGLNHKKGRRNPFSFTSEMVSKPTVRSWQFLDNWISEMFSKPDSKKLAEFLDKRGRAPSITQDDRKISRSNIEGIEEMDDDPYRQKANGSRSGESAADSERDEMEEITAAAEREKERAQAAGGGFVSGEDDGVSMLTADEYITLRLTPQLARFMVDTPSLHRLTSSVTALIIFFSVFSSILSTFGYIQFIPAMFAISGAATAWTSYNQTDLVLVQTNAAINQLNQLVIWWDALSMIEKRVGANKEFLVMITETAIQGQVVGYASKAKQKDERDDDESK